MISGEGEVSLFGGRVMRRSRWFGLVAAFVVAWPLLAADEKPAPKEKAEPKEKLVKTGELQGKLAQLPDKGTLKLSVYVGREWKSYDLPVGDDLKVRTLVLPQNFDDKGKVTRYTPKQLDEKKGPDKKAPGYTAEVTDLKANQPVTVYLFKKVGKPKNPKDKDEAAEYQPRVGTIIIRGEP